MTGRQSRAEQMNILFAGTPPSAAIVLRNLIANKHHVVAVLTREDSQVGRKKILTPSAVALEAENLGLPVIKSNRVTEDTIFRILATGAELAVVVAYGTILSTRALSALPNGWFNLHYSLLPAFRGAAPVQHAIIEGLRETGITLFKIDEGMDTGPIVASLPVSIEPAESAGGLISRMSELGSTLLNQELPKIYNGLGTLTEQQGQATFAPKILRDQARVDFKKDARDVVNFIQGMNPEPMAWFTYADQPIRILRAVTAYVESDHPGEVLSTERAIIGCGSGSAIELLEVQPSGKTVMSGKDWLRGLRDPGDLV